MRQQIGKIKFFINTRQKELARKKKKEQKKQGKLEKATIKSEENQTQSQIEGENLKN